MRRYIFCLLITLVGSLPITAWSQTTGAETVTVTAIVGSGGVGNVPGRTSIGGGSIGLQNGIRFSGYAYPEAAVIVLKNGSEIARTTSTSTAYFTITLDEQYSQNTLYTLYALDKNNEQSLLINYPLVTRKGYLTHIENIRFAPTFTADKVEVRAGDYLTLSGYAIPGRQIVIDIFSTLFQKQYTTIAAPTGIYKITIPMGVYSKGEYSARSHYGDTMNRYSSVKHFTIGANTITRGEATENIPGDCNADQQITIVDFSVVAFWYGKRNPPPCVDTKKDGVINLVDFSILAYYWTK